MNIKSATLTFDNSSHRSRSHVMVNFNRVVKLSIPNCITCSLRIANSDLGINLSFAFVFAVDAGDEAFAIVVESVQAGGAGRTISWFVVILWYEIVTASGIDADVLPLRDANAFPPSPSIRVFTLVRTIGGPGTGMDVVIGILCLSRFSNRRSGCRRDVKNEEDSRELDMDFVEHCNQRKDLW